MTDERLPRFRILREDGWRLRVAALALFLIALVTIWTTNRTLTERFAAIDRSEAQVQLALYSGNLMSELRRNSVVPLLLSRDPALIGALTADDFSQSTQRLISYQDEIGSASIFLLDETGRAVATTNRVELGSQHRGEPFYVNALRSNDTVFTVVREDTGLARFFYSRAVKQGPTTLGVIVVEVDLRKYEESWSQFATAVIVTDSSGEVLLTTTPGWRGLTEAEALAVEPANSPIERAFRATTDWTASSPDAYLKGSAVMRNEARIPFQGWRIGSFINYGEVRERVNAVLALEVMAFAILLALLFYSMSVRAERRSDQLMRESEQLRALNDLLQHEISERQRAERNLEFAEQSLAQSSKLAALGEMSAAVSHELNQPLAAMKTYLAGARLLIARQRTDQAVASFQRIDHMINRMSAITRQLKSYAHRGAETEESFDLRDALSAVMAMMEPQVHRQGVRLSISQPEGAVMVEGDQLRVEQVIVNLLRNALDAVSDVETPQVDVIMAVGRKANLTIRDNGGGIVDLDALFEPFYTTKAPGDGLGLGLAISSGIVTNMGGRLTGRNRPDGAGAVFEMVLPLASDRSLAAE
ncbi:MAG: ATP-binding protein [Rhodobacteraceae bacterium]|nr:ATP-binding protein [Paracoccaceae bacterium]